MWGGIDTHKDTLAVGVIDAVGRPLVVREVCNSTAGFASLERLLVEHDVIRVGIEGSGNYGRAVAAHLVIAGTAEVVEVPPGLTFRERGGAPGAGKTDPGDAVAIARIVAREQRLPPVRLMIGAAADLRALLDYRQQLIDERVRIANRVHVELGGLRPGYQTRLPSLIGRHRVAAARRLLRGDNCTRAELTRRRLDRLTKLDVEIAQLKARIAALVTASGTRLTGLFGVGPLVAARIQAEVVDVRRYRSPDAFAAANGTAPIPASSGRTVRHRLNRGGNRQLNKALQIIAVTQLRGNTEGRRYYDRKRAAGKTRREAQRCLKRRLSDVVYHLLREDLDALEQTPPSQTGTPAAA